MIKLGVLQFGNCLPFGDNISIDLSQHTTTQLVGKNGSGKSSIPLILEEVLYNKNSKGVAKGDLLNRYSGASEYWMKLDFEVNGVPYVIEKVVKTTTKVTLTSKGVNIGGHTSTQTYKIIAEILGMDMTTFSKLVYQSLNSSLDFLTATDGNRKKFLINLLNLEKYPAIESKIKETRKELGVELASLVKEKDRLEGIIKNTTIPDIVEEVVIPDSLTNKHSEILKLSENKSTIRNEISNLKDKVKAEIDSRNKDIEIKKHQILEWDRLFALCNSIDKDREHVEDTLYGDVIRLREELNSHLRPDPSKILDIKNYVSELDAEYNRVIWEMGETKKRYKNFSTDAAETVCTSCNSPLDKAHALKEAENQKTLFIASKTKRDELEATLNSAKGELNILLDMHNKYIDAETMLGVTETALTRANNSLTKKQQELVKLLGVSIGDVISANPTSKLLSTKPTLDLESTKPTLNLGEETKKLELEIVAIDSEISQINLDILNRDKEILQAQNHNMVAVKNNTKRELLQDTFNSAKVELNDITSTFSELQKRITNIDVLTKVFSPKGLIAYKLEACVKVFENKVNQYLADVSNGKFALGFELDEANLKVVMYSSGKQVNIKTLSSGELSKVNISTLLSIRSLMSAVSKNSLNTLFLDEVVSTIDTDGMEDLIEVLIKEHNLNTFVVSHNYQHPLVEVLKVVKENNISRLEDGNRS